MDSTADSRLLKRKPGGMRGLGLHVYLATRNVCLEAPLSLPSHGPTSNSDVVILNPQCRQTRRRVTSPSRRSVLRIRQSRQPHFRQAMPLLPPSVASRLAVSSAICRSVLAIRGSHPRSKNAGMYSRRRATSYPRLAISANVLRGLRLVRNDVATDWATNAIAQQSYQ